MDKITRVIKNLKLWRLILGVLWLALLVGIWAICQNRTMLAAISTWVLIGGIGVAIWQIIETRRSTNEQLETARRNTDTQFAVGLFQEFRNKETLKILRYIYELPPKEDGKCLSKVHKNEIDYVLDKLGRLGVLVANGIIDEELAIEAFGGVTSLKCWYKLKNYIEKVRERQGLHWGIYVEYFASRTLDHWKNKKDWVLYYRNEGDKSIDLVRKFDDDKNLCPRRFEKGELSAGQRGKFEGAK